MSNWITKSLKRSRAPSSIALDEKAKSPPDSELSVETPPAPNTRVPLEDYSINARDTVKQIWVEQKEE
jgi:hypothetical protein